MVKVNIPSGEYSIKFEYNMKKRTTVASVARLDNGDVIEVSRAKTRCSRCDFFNKRVGRKLALAQAIKSFDRAERTEIWTQFFSQCKM